MTKSKKNTLWRAIGCIILALIIALSAWQLYQVQIEYDKENEIHATVLKYKPTADDLIFVGDGKKKANPKILALQKIYPDVVGWLTVPGTRIDYPFAQSDDNIKYLRQDLNLNPLRAGTVFIDSRCKKDFSSFNTVIYGHNMRNATMFGELESFLEAEFFNSHKTAEIFLNDRTYNVEIFAVISTDSENKNFYVFNIDSTDAKNTFLSYVKKSAVHYRDVNVTSSDKLVTLSTCLYDFTGQREAIVGKLVEVK